MSGAEVLIVGAAAAFGAFLTAVAGLGGGILLLTVMVTVMEPGVAIPVHGVIQLASNGSRTVILRRDVDWPVVGRFAVLLVPAGVLGFLAADQLPVTAGRIAIAVLALLIVWWPAALASTTALLGSGRAAFVPLGGIAGFLNIPFGVTGPAIAPVFRRHLVERAAVVATFGAAQTAGHLAKIGVFAGGGFDLAGHLTVSGVGIGAAIAGTWVGTRALHRIDERTFGHLFRLVLTAVAARVVLSGLW